MSRSKFTESEVEDAALAWFEALGYTILHGPEIAPGEPAAERDSFEEVVLKGRLQGRLQAALARFNPDVPAVAIGTIIG